MKDPVHIKFRNRQNPNAEFDFIRLEDLYVRKNLGHSPFELHLVEFYIILLIEDGEGIHTVDFSEYVINKGSLVTIRKDQIHKFSNNPDLKGSILLFTDEFLISYLEKLEALKSLQLFNEFLGIQKIQLEEVEMAEISKLTSRIRTEYFEVNDTYSQEIIRSELHILLTRLYRIKSRNKQIIEHRKYLEPFIGFQNLVESNASNYLHVKEYAALMGVSTKTLNTICRNIVNKSAKEFIDDIYTKQIKRLLINTELSIKEIAYASGFEETTNFYKYFRRKTELTPEQFRNNFR